jgi:putative pyruvate formate lyase activating enzyme
MVDHFEPAYGRLLESGELAARVGLAFQRLEACDCCPRRCGANRLDAGQNATCRTGEMAVVASYGPHMGEEDPLRGYRGSGTIFFSWCNLRCVFCQNYDISQFGRGRPTFPEELAAMMLELEAGGCHNINLVSPSHVVPQILSALLIAAKAGLRIPLVYNSGGYDALETLQLLDGVVDIYMPDMKYADPDIGRRLSGVPDYPAVNRQAVKEMHRQVGDLVMDERGIAQRGLLVRHLVLPNQLAGSADIIRFLAREVSAGTYLNLMDQYRPCHKAGKYPELNRRITQEEYNQALEVARETGIERLDKRQFRIF